ncbi:C40 family peptidase [Agarivorans sp. Toyoura001]|uniref:C40 family peptidase n=1 Tax=Agarivorans sp. Toyoura001 TaxID=2283141 RepID=UPI0010F8ABA5|nr:NlpC/P60 family protein [Agarivorans sp. Toyoura001]
MKFELANNVVLSYQLLALFIAGMWLVGCSSQSSTSGGVNQQANSISGEQTQFLALHKQWQGTPYKLGGSNKAGIDCSAFVQHLYSSIYQKQLPRTTQAQMQQGKTVNLAKARTGDLVFFKTSHKVRHVGVIYDQQHFLHASTSKGVIFSRLDNVYWSPKIITIKRL